MPPYICNVWGSGSFITSLIIWVICACCSTEQLFIPSWEWRRRRNGLGEDFCAIINDQSSDSNRRGKNNELIFLPLIFWTVGEENKMLPKGAERLSPLNPKPYHKRLTEARAVTFQSERWSVSILLLAGEDTFFSFLSSPRQPDLPSQHPEFCVLGDRKHRASISDRVTPSCSVLPGWFHSKRLN